MFGLRRKKRCETNPTPRVELAIQSPEGFPAKKNCPVFGCLLSFVLFPLVGLGFRLYLFFCFSCPILIIPPAPTLIGGVALPGFKMPTGVPIPQPVAADSSGAGAEEDGMPKEDPSKLERAPGEEDEEVGGCIVTQVSASLSFLVERVGGSAVRSHYFPGPYQATLSGGILRRCRSGFQPWLRMLLELVGRKYQTEIRIAGCSSS